MTLSKEEWYGLAKAYIEDRNLLDDLYNTKRKINKKYGLETDFVGDDHGTLKLQLEVLMLLGEEFEYFVCECDRNWDKYNYDTMYEDGSHPNCHSLEDLYEEEIKNGGK